MKSDSENRLKNSLKYGERCIREEAQALLDLIPQLDENFERAVDLIYHCRGKVIVTGVGKSGNIGAKIAATLSSTGTPAFFINPLDAYHGDLGVMTSDDVVLALSNSGHTDELLRFVPMLLHMNVPIIGMSRNPNSLLAKYSTVHIQVKVDHEACPLNLAPTSSTTAVLAMGDALAVALMQVRDFRPRDFAQFHPGGELGKRLLTTAEDVMRTDDLPIISQDMHLGEAIIEVSKGKRWQEQFFNRTVSDIMTRNPKIVTPQTKVTEIQRVMHLHKIHSVLVCNKQNKLLGIVDSYASSMLNQ